MGLKLLKDNYDVVNTIEFFGVLNYSDIRRFDYKGIGCDLSGVISTLNKFRFVDGLFGLKPEVSIGLFFDKNDNVNVKYSDLTLLKEEHTCTWDFVKDCYLKYNSRNFDKQKKIEEYINFKKSGMDFDNYTNHYPKKWDFSDDVLIYVENISKESARLFFPNLDRFLDAYFNLITTGLNVEAEVYTDCFKRFMWSSAFNNIGPERLRNIFHRVVILNKNEYLNDCYLRVFYDEDGDNLYFSNGGIF